MYPLDKTAWEVLNATADDWENLEQIYKMVCLEFSPKQYEKREQGAYFFRPGRGAPSLEEIADQICELVEAGFLAARQGESGAPVSDFSDRRYVWRAWFRMTPAGQQAWDSSEYATLAEQEQAR
jgi:hypothetical protein